LLEQCPVCLNAIELSTRRDYGERNQIECPRCGPYEISGTALAMLQSRVSQDALVRARLSHAIRSETSKRDRLFVGSTNLDELCRRPLPDVEHQLQKLVLSLSALLDDDRLGQRAMPDLEPLAGMVGAVDSKRVSRLIDYALKRGVIESVDRGATFGISPAGWEIASGTQGRNTETTGPKEMAPETVTVSAHCDGCGGDRKSLKKATHTNSGDDEGVSWSETYEILECCGCGKMSVRRIFWLSEWDNIDQDPVTGKPRLIRGEEITCWPPVTKRKQPEWSKKLQDDILRQVMAEVYQALNGGLIVLSSIGTRTLLDRAMFLCIGDPKGGFQGKLKLMLDNGHVGKDELDILGTITDAGSAAAHRGFAPSAETLHTIVDTVENFLHREFVLKLAAKKVKDATPPRPGTTPRSS